MGAAAVWTLADTMATLRRLPAYLIVSAILQSFAKSDHTKKHRLRIVQPKPPPPAEIEGEAEEGGAVGSGASADASAGTPIPYVPHSRPLDLWGSI